MSEMEQRILKASRSLSVVAMDTAIAWGLLSGFDASSASFLHPENKQRSLIWAVGQSGCYVTCLLLKFLLP